MKTDKKFQPSFHLNNLSFSDALELIRLETQINFDSFQMTR